MRVVVFDGSFPSWRLAARRLLQERVPPDRLIWRQADDEQALLPELMAETWQPAPLEEDHASERSTPIRVPQKFVELACRAGCHRDPQRWSTLYRTLWRLVIAGERHLLDVAVDPDVGRLLEMDKAVRRDVHKMHAFVRFRRVIADAEECFVAWHRPDHLIVRLSAPFFARRFGAMCWSILTPGLSAHWDTRRLSYSPGMPVEAAPADDELEGLWRTYYASIFNPARLKLWAMRREMPSRHWPTLPETQILPDLLREAPRRIEAMMARTAAAQCTSTGSAADFLPGKLELPVLAKAAQKCRGCDLYCHATQAVFGEGPTTARLMLVGEQPGDQEDLAGHPFVGPAGQVLDEALEAAGIGRKQVYVTNAVKHFKWTPRGKRRLHAKPTMREVSACRPWLEAELQTVKPEMLVLLGSTAAQSLLGSGFRVTRHRGEILKTEWSNWTLATVHPSSLLRIPDPAARREAREQFLADFRLVAKHLKKVTAR